MHTAYSVIGEQNHRMLHHLELAAKRIGGMGFGPNQAARLAAIMTFRLEGFPRQEALDAAQKLYPKENDETKQTAPDNLDVT